MDEPTLAALITLGVHDLTTNIVHKRAVLNGEQDECRIIGDAIATRARVEHPEWFQRPVGWFPSTPAATP